MNTSSLEYGEDHLGRLADKVSAPDEVRQDIDRMGHAAQAWLDGIRAIPPNIVEVAWWNPTPPCSMRN